MHTKSPLSLNQRLLFGFVSILLLPGVALDAAARQLTEPASGGVEIVHLGNEGFLLVAGEQKVLIDALFGDGLDNYPAVPLELRQPLEAAQGRFAGVDLVLASHVHPDHFDPTAVARHLKANPGARFVSTEQAAEKLLAVGVAAEKVSGFWPPDGERRTIEYAGVEVTALRLHHGGSPAQNLGLVITIGGTKVLHMGDTEITAGELAPVGLEALGIDVVLVPYWYLDSRRLAPALAELGEPHLVAMHFPTADAPANYFGDRVDLAGQVEACREAFPDAWMALEPGESRRFYARSTAGR